MSLRISNVRLSVDEPEAVLPERLARILGLAPAALGHWRILRKSLDARNKNALQFVYTAEVSLLEDEDRIVRAPPEPTIPPPALMFIRKRPSSCPRRASGRCLIDPW